MTVTGALGPPLWAILLHLSAYAQLGVLTRVYIGKLFGGACSSPGRWQWAPCVSSPGLTRPGGVFFTDFPANVVGSFLIGILSSGSVLQSVYPRVEGAEDHVATQLLFLPSRSPLQSHSALHVGLRTGYCGSLTTLSSWISQVVIMMVGRTNGVIYETEWVAALWALYLGLAGPLLALVLGQHAALAAGWAWKVMATARAAARAGATPASPAVPGEASEHAYCPLDGPPSKSNSTSSNATATAAAAVAVGFIADGCGGGVGAVQGRHADVEAGAGSGAGGAPGLPTRDTIAVAVGAAGQQGAVAHPGAVHVQLGPGPSVAFAEPDPDPAGGKLPEAATSSGRQRTSTSSVSRKLRRVQTPCARRAKELQREALWRGAADAFSLVVLLVLTGVSLAYVYLDRDGDVATYQRYVWFSILFGPAGAILRWYLSRYNALPASWSGCGGRGAWAWLQLGTYGANVGACVLNFVVDALLLRAVHRPVSRSVLQGIMTGTSGCLSTVSTWVVEIQKLGLTTPMASYKYAAFTIVTSVSLGLLVYGVPAWTY